MQTMKSFLKELAGYDDTEIWAMDYLGENNTRLDLNDPHRNHIARFRTFADQVRDYLGVERLDFIAHSLGCGVVNGYLRGLQPNGEWDNSDHRLNVVSTCFPSPAPRTGSVWVGQANSRPDPSSKWRSHRLNSVVDDTPAGSSNPSAQGHPRQAGGKSPRWTPTRSGMSRSRR